MKLKGMAFRLSHKLVENPMALAIESFEVYFIDYLQFSLLS